MIIGQGIYNSDLRYFCIRILGQGIYDSDQSNLLYKIASWS